MICRTPARRAGRGTQDEASCSSRPRLQTSSPASHRRSPLPGASRAQLARELYEVHDALLLAGLPFVAWQMRRDRIAAALIVGGSLLLFAPPQRLPAAQVQAEPVLTAATFISIIGLAWACASPTPHSRWRRSEAGMAQVSEPHPGPFVKFRCLDSHADQNLHL